MWNAHSGIWWPQMLYKHPNCWMKTADLNKAWGERRSKMCVMGSLSSKSRKGSVCSVIECVLPAKTYKKYESILHLLSYCFRWLWLFKSHQHLLSKKCLTIFECCREMNIPNRKQERCTSTKMQQQEKVYFLKSYFIPAGTFQQVYFH